MDSGAVTPQQLERMMASDATVSDLVIMLDNAEHVQDMPSAGLPTELPAELPAELSNIDVAAVAGLLNHVIS